MTYLYQVIYRLAIHTMHFYDNDVLETVYWKQGESIKSAVVVG